MTRTTSWLGSREMGGAGCSACYHMLSTASSELSHPILTADCCQWFLSGNYSQKEGCWLWKVVWRVLKKLGIKLPSVQFSSVQLLSCVRLFATPWIAACQASLSITNSRSSLKLTSIELVMPSSHLILCHPLLLLPPIPPSIRVFSNESTLRMRWPKMEFQL